MQETIRETSFIGNSHPRASHFLFEPNSPNPQNHQENTMSNPNVGTPLNSLGGCNARGGIPIGASSITCNIDSGGLRRQGMHSHTTRRDLFVFSKRINPQRFLKHYKHACGGGICPPPTLDFSQDRKCVVLGPNGKRERGLWTDQYLVPNKF